MTKPINDLTAEYVKSILDYDPKTGEFKWKVSRPPRGRAGRPAGFINVLGYRVIAFNGRELYAHRIGWFIMTGAWPVKDIDHINGDRSDNRFCNFREATRGENIRNSKQRGSLRCPKGVAKNLRGGKFSAKITFEYKVYYLGSFNTPEEAHEAYCTAAKKFHKEFARFH